MASGHWTTSRKASGPHPFSTKRGKAFRRAILLRDIFTCQMCGTLLREGRKDSRAAVVDHVKPIDLCPDLTWDESNCRSVCRRCHAVCDSIEKRLSPDSEAISAAKRRYRPVGRDGYPVRP